MILLIGANIADNHPILCAAPWNATSTSTLIVADPRVTKTAMMADIFLPVKPRSDIALLNGIAHILIRDGLIDQELHRAHTTGFDELAAVRSRIHAGACRGDHRARPRAMIEQVAMLYGRRESGLHRLDDGREPLDAGRRDRERDQQSGAVSPAISAAGASPFSITGQCNAMRNGFAETVGLVW